MTPDGALPQSRGARPGRGVSGDGRSRTRGADRRRPSRWKAAKHSAPIAILATTLLTVVSVPTSLLIGEPCCAWTRDGSLPSSGRTGEGATHPSSVVPSSGPINAGAPVCGRGWRRRRSSRPPGGKDRQPQEPQRPDPRAQVWDACCPSPNRDEWRRVAWLPATDGRGASGALSLHTSGSSGRSRASQRPPRVADGASDLPRQSADRGADAETAVSDENRMVRGSEVPHRRR